MKPSNEYPSPSRLSPPPHPCLCSAVAPRRNLPVPRLERARQYQPCPNREARLSPSTRSVAGDIARRSLLLRLPQPAVLFGNGIRVLLRARGSPCRGLAAARRRLLYLSVTVEVVWEGAGAVVRVRSWRGGCGTGTTAAAAFRFSEARWRLLGLRERATLTFEVALPLVGVTLATVASTAAGDPEKNVTMLLIVAA